MVQQGKQQHCQIKACVCILSNKCVCECEKMFTMQLNRESFVDEVQSAPVFFWGGVFDQKHLKLLRLSFVCSTAHMGIGARPPLLL